MAWRIVTGAVADWAAVRDPLLALRWRPHDPLATRALVGQTQPVHVSSHNARVRTVLAFEPLEGWAFTDIAASGDAKSMRALYAIAVRRAPREVEPRVRLLNLDLRSRDYIDAMRHVDVLLRLKPPYRAYLYPRLRGLAADPAFANALATTLRERPGWRPEFLQLAQQAGDADAWALMRLLARDRVLDEDEHAAWVEALMQRHRWREAYAQWVQRLRPPPGSVPWIFNSQLSKRPSNRGFDWRTPDVAGADLDLTREPGAIGAVAHVRFDGRPAVGLNLEQALLLAPGRYRLRIRMRATDLRANDGVRWTVTCDSDGSIAGRTAPLSGTFDWRNVVAEFDVPSAGCDGQWLRARNPAPDGLEQVMSGEVWVDGAEVQAVAGVEHPVIASLEKSAHAVLHSSPDGFRRAWSGMPLAAGDGLVALDGTPFRVAYVDGCSESADPSSVYVISENACTAGAARPAAAMRPRVLVIAVLPEAESWPLPPIGR